MAARLREAILVHITAEPSDLPGRIAVGASLFPRLGGWFLPPFGTEFWGIHNQLFHGFMDLWIPLTWMIIFGGLLSRSRSAKALGILAIASLAMFSGAIRFGIPLQVFTSLTGWILHDGGTVILGIWGVRTLRRWLARGED
jgi:hypothetical protein